MKKNIELYKNALPKDQFIKLRKGEAEIKDFLSAKKIKELKTEFYKEFLSLTQINLLSDGKAKLEDFLTQDEIEEIKSLGRIDLEDSRICVRKVFRLTKQNYELLKANPYKKSEVLHKALNNFFHKLHYKEKKLITLKISRKESPLTGLWIEIGNNEKIKELLEHDKTLTIQLICNHALEQYFKQIGA